MKLSNTIKNIKKSKSIFFNLKGKMWINKDLVRLGLVCQCDFPNINNIIITTKKLRPFFISSKFFSLDNYYIYENIIIEDDEYYRQLYYETK